MTDYKLTLNLPNTAFPMKANLAQTELKFLQKWQEMDLYKQIQAETHGRKQFILHDGPPYANGDIHLGHALNKILKDIVVKSKRLSGFDAPYVPGWDCHGLPVEIQVEKKYGRPGPKMPVAEFRQKCRDYAQSQIDKQRSDFIRLGVVGDWFNPYATMLPTYEADIIRSLARIIDRGHMVQGYKPVHWCMDCGSALAEAEVEYQDKSSPSIDVKFRFLDAAQCCNIFGVTATEPVSIVIWTTTPWTLPANEAVAVGADIEYALVQCNTSAGVECLVLAADLVAAVAERTGISDYKILATTAGKNLERLKLQHPFIERHPFIILGDHVTLDTGTGCVHTAPGHGEDDFQVGQRYGLPVDHPVDARGVFMEGTPYFAGMHIFKANDAIIDHLRESGNLLFATVVQHSYPHCWRHKKPIIFRATPQWFISMDHKNLRKQALDAIRTVQWFPEWGEARIFGMIDKSPDWCISRQRTWCVPIPVFVHKETQQLHPRTTEIMQQVADLVAISGIDAWYTADAEQFIGSEAADYLKASDGLDVWFDSGVSHTAVLERRSDLSFPADLYLEGSDQHRGWFQSSLKTSVAMYGCAPYKQVLTHGFTVDASGRKMSKSLGNTMAPQEITKTLGADVLRLWVAATDYRGELSFSDEIIKRVSEGYRRIRNTARYLLSNLDGFDPATHLVDLKHLVGLDRWILYRAQQLQQDVLSAYNSYQFHQIYQAVHNFCSLELGAFYLDIIKDRQYTLPTNSPARRSAQTVMYHIAEALVRWLAPILSFTAEEIWQFLPGEHNESVFLQTWYEFPTGLSAGMDEDFWRNLSTARDAVNKALEAERALGHIGAPLEAKVTIYCEAPYLNCLQTVGTELRFFLITSATEVLPLAAKPAELAVNELNIAVSVQKVDHEKCVRCWHRTSDIGVVAAHPELCGRCVENIEGEGEHRQYI